MSTFLDADEVAILTGRKMKTRQIEALRKMAIPFFVNALGYAVVARSAVDRAPVEQKKDTRWKSNLAKA